MKSITIISTCIDDWGGCEELWARTIPYLNNRGFYTTVFKSTFNVKHREVRKLLNRGVSLKELSPLQPFINRSFRKVKELIRKTLDSNYYVSAEHYKIREFEKHLRIEKPNLVLISQAINFDGLRYASECIKHAIPYIIISHKAVDFFWPYVTDKSLMKETWREALLSCFVSQHNLTLTEEHFGVRLPNSRIVFNPIKINRHPLEFPSTKEGYRVACIGRLFLIDKGQDILIRILNQDKWKNRSITISLIGSGPDEQNIQEMIDLYQLDNVRIEKYVEDIESLWLNYHALILPSRSEGLPLTIIEAMAAGRPVIVSNAGGNAEMVCEGETGFVGEANKISFDQAMEAAWDRRHDWKNMGLTASNFIQRTIPQNPEKEFAELLISHVC